MIYKNKRITYCKSCGNVEIINNVNYFYLSYCAKCRNYSLADVPDSGIININICKYIDKEEKISDIGNFELEFLDKNVEVDFNKILNRMKKERDAVELKTYIKEKISKIKCEKDIYRLKVDNKNDKDRIVLYKNENVYKRYKTILRRLIYTSNFSIDSCFSKDISILSGWIYCYGKHKNYNKLMKILEYPCIEVLLKAGIVFNFFKGYGTNISIIDSININGKNPKEILGISKKGVKCLKDIMNKEIPRNAFHISNKIIEVYNKLLKFNLDEVIHIKRITDYINEKEAYIKKFLNLSYFMPANDNQLVNLYSLIKEYNLNEDKVLEYLTDTVVHEQGSYSIGNNITTYIDLFRINKLLEITKFEHYPRSLTLAHDKATYLKLINQEEISTKMFAKVVEENEKLIYENKTYKILLPKSAADLVAEGSLLNHCVGTYVNRYAEGYSKIFFMRKKEDLDAALITIELNSNNSLVQAKGHCNRHATKEEQDFINEWLKHIKNVQLKKVV